MGVAWIVWTVIAAGGEPVPARHALPAQIDDTAWLEQQNRNVDVERELEAKSQRRREAIELVAELGALVDDLEHAVSPLPDIPQPKILNARGLEPTLRAAVVCFVTRRQIVEIAQQLVMLLETHPEDRSALKAARNLDRQAGPIRDLLRSAPPPDEPRNASDHDARYARTDENTGSKPIDQNTA